MCDEVTITCADCNYSETKATNLNWSCPKCGGKKSMVEVSFSDNVPPMHESLSGKQFSPIKRREQGKTGKSAKKPIQEFFHGDDYSHKLGKYVDKNRVLDRENDHYHEVVVDKESGEIIHEQKHKLSEHIGHGSAKMNNDHEQLNLQALKTIDSIDFSNDDDSYFQEIYPNIYLMDNHKWALYCWELYRHDNDIPSTIVHLDYHWDGINDYHENEEEIETVKLSELKDIIIEENYIRKDSFIAPSIIRGYVNRIHFHCFQTDTEIGLDDCLLEKCDAKQYVHDTIEELLAVTGSELIILDIDLDIFNRSTNFLDGDLWSNEEIIEYISKITPLIREAKVITIAMSYGYSGSNAEREFLTKFVVPKIIDIRGT